MKAVFRIVFWIGVLLLLVALYFTQYFAILLITGIVLIIFSLIEQQLLKKHEPKDPLLRQSRALLRQQKPILFTPPQEKKEAEETKEKTTNKVLGKLFKKKEEQPAVETAFLEKKEQTNHEDIQKEEGIQRKQPEGEADKLEEYLKEAIKEGHPKDQIKIAAQQAHWPEELVEEQLNSLLKGRKKKKGIVLLLILALFIIALVILHINDMLLFSYLFEQLSNSSPKFYIGTILVILAIILYFIIRIRRIVKKKKVQQTAQQQVNVAAIKDELAHKKQGAHQTVLDQLYDLIIEKKKLTVTEIAKSFGISKEEAEEWGKILAEQNLVEVYYPTVGDPEIKWKPSKPTP